MDVLAIAASGMQQDALRLQSAAQNLSNVLTPGYKKQVVSTQAFAAQFAMLGQVRAPSVSAASMPVMMLDSSPGTMRSTGIPTDVTIDGAGFFELAGTEGPVYTRQGQFRVDAAGRLLGPQSLSVMGGGGEIVLSADPFTISANGDITQNGAVVARLKIVKFDHAELLEPMGGTGYRQGGAVLDENVTAVRVRSGYLENSNVDSAREMVSLTETVRHFEALQKLVQGYDEVLEKSIRKLGEF